MSSDCIKDQQMRNSYLLVWICLVPAISLNAQNNPVYQPFQVDIAMGMAIKQNGSTGGEVRINPGYTIAGRYKAGIQFDGVVYNNWSTGSSILTFDYFFIRTPEFRISAGGGYGFYNSSYFFQTAKPPEMSQAQSTTGKMGGMIRIGFEWHHLSLGFAYNFVPAMYVSTSSGGYLSAGGYLTTTDTYKNGFFGLTLGLIIGRRKNKFSL